MPVFLWIRWYWVFTELSWIAFQDWVSIIWWKEELFFFLWRVLYQDTALIINGREMFNKTKPRGFRRQASVRIRWMEWPLMNQWRTENEPRNNRRGASWPPSRIFHGVSIQRSRIERYSRTLQETLAVENKKEWFKEKKRERDRGVAQEVVAHDSLRLSRSTFSSLGAIFGLELVLRFPEDKTMQPS